LARVRLRYPLFVKPVAEGSGKGIFANNLCKSRSQLVERVQFLLSTYKEPVLVESYLPGPEFTVAIIGNGSEARCLPIVGFDFSTLPPGATPVYGFEAKWIWDTPEHQLQIFECPARVPEAMYRDVERVALEAYQALGCRDWCRVDVRLDEAGVPNVVELNPLPGIIPDPRMNSCFPKAARAAGYTYDELIQEVVQIAWRRVRGVDLFAVAEASA
jgi:D-alanine-D-alanine ligase